MHIVNPIRVIGLSLLLVLGFLLNLSRPTHAQGLAPASTFKVGLEVAAEGLKGPLHLTHANDGSGRIFVTEKAGRVMIVRDGKVAAKPFLDITSIVGSSASEQGLLSIAFHPNYKETGFLFVSYTDRRGDTVIARYKVSADDPDSIDVNSAKTVLTQDQPYSNHNGGLIKFGPDKFLYIGLGDGGSAGDPQGNGQKLDTLLGKILRIHVDSGDPYGIPPTNPFSSVTGGRQGRPEIWAFGLRNPWRFSFDRANGDLFIADVGQSSYEEVNYQPADSTGGENYGWVIMEGKHCYRGGSCDQSGLVIPVAEYGRDSGCSVTGGYVYRGKTFPRFQGTYFFGDYCSGLIWALQPITKTVWTTTKVLDSKRSISSFGEDEAGELYLTDLANGTVYRIVDLAK
jgi:glucose/arabinose dehydrogenase